MGTEIPVSDAARADRQGSTEMRDGILSAARMRDSGNEHPGGPCAFAGESTTKAIDLGVDGRPERTYRDPAVHSLSDVKKEALLGKSLLGQRLLCGYGGPEQRDDSEIRAVPGKGRVTSAAASTGTWSKRAF